MGDLDDRGRGGIRGVGGGLSVRMGGCDEG